jgi:hypothetical protein
VLSIGKTPVVPVKGGHPETVALEIGGVETVCDPPATFVQHSGLFLHLPFTR